MRPSPNLESSTPTNTRTPQLRKKHIKRMKRKKGRSMVVTSLVLTLPAGHIPEWGYRDLPQNDTISTTLTIGCVASGYLLRAVAAARRSDSGTHKG